MNFADNESFSFKSVTKDTKAKFEALLKASLLKKSSISKEKLVETEIQSISSTSEIIEKQEFNPDNKNFERIQEDEETTVDVHSNEKDFKFSKFFKESSNQLQKVATNTNDFPVPKPRKSIINNEDDNSNSSKGTYETKRSNSGDSKGTYKIDQSRNNSPAKNVNESKNIDIKKASPKKKKNFSKQGESIELQEISNQQNEIEIKEDIISYVDELNEIPKPRTKKIKGYQSTKTDAQETPIREYSYENIICIQIIKTDNLKLDSFIVHPVVKIHFIDITTGKYLLKSNAIRSMLFYYENKDIKYIGPIMTNIFNLQKEKTMYSYWNESVIINEDFNYFMDNKNVILLFEVMDFLNASIIQNQKGKKDAWHRIAWAFLRHTSPLDGSINVNKKVRLQLYKPGLVRKHVPHDQCDIFHWWKDLEWKKYPSSLYIAIKELKFSQVQASGNSIRSKNPLEGERSQNKINFKTTNLNNSNGGLKDGEEQLENEVIKQLPQDKNLIEQNLNEIKWSRSFYQTCKIPNTLLTKLEVPNEGCFLLSFSNNGLLLACGVFVNNVYSILIYSIVTFEEICFFSAHQDFIYSISWSNDDRLLITASSDWTVCIWDVKNKKYIQMLPHPSFVYSSIFSATNQIATGCYDNTIRIWSIDNKNSYELHQELEGHAGYVTTLCFNKNGNILFSGDSLGVLKSWRIKSGEALWNLKREYNILDLKGIVFNEIILHPREKRIFIYSRDKCVRLVDLKNGYVMQQFFCGKTNRSLRYFTISPCFTLLFCPTEEQGKIHIRNINSTKLLASYKPFNNNNAPVSCVRFHPFDNIIAISQYASSTQYVLLYKFDNNSVKEMIGLESYDSGKALSNGDTKKMPPKKLERLNNKRKTVESDDTNSSEIGQRELLLENENKEYRNNLREIIEKMDRVIDGKFDILANI